MNTYIMSVCIDNRCENSPLFQTALSKYGCHLLGRFGIPLPDGRDGIVVLVVLSEEDLIKDLKSELEAISGITTNYMLAMDAPSGNCGCGCGCK